MTEVEEEEGSVFAGALALGILDEKKRAKRAVVAIGRCARYGSTICWNIDGGMAALA